MLLGEIEVILTLVIAHRNFAARAESKRSATTIESLTSRWLGRPTPLLLFIASSQGQYCRNSTAHSSLIRCMNLNSATVPYRAMSAFNGIDVFPNKGFPYKPLWEEMGEIRIVTLRPGTRQDEAISCSLSHVNILEYAESQQHEALSYTWGNPNDLVPITLNDVPFQVTKNLELAFRYLRLPDRDRILWVDAICINQNDTNEKSFQVSSMWATYSNARQTIVWLGEASENSDLALQIIEDVASGEVDPLFDPGQIRENIITHRPYTPSEAAKWTALVDLFARPWWQRVWVVQEVAFARRCTLVCGNRTIDWKAIKGAWLTIASAADRSLLSVTEQTKMRNAKLVGGMERSKPAEFGTVLSAALSSTATDLRDKVYACLNLMRNEKSFEPRMHIDYTKSISEVYFDAAMKLIDLDGDLRVLTMCEPDFELSRLTAFDGIQRHVVDNPARPSWVPNFANARSAGPLWGSYEHGSNPSLSKDDYTGYYHPRYEPYRAGSIGVAKYRFADPNELIVTGARAGLVKDVGEDVYGKSNTGSYTNILIAADSVIRKQETVIGGENSSRQDIIWRTLTANRTIQGYQWPQDFEWQDNKYNQDVIESVARSNIGRVFIATGDGLLGLAPRGTRPMDAILVVPGLHVPLIVRSHRTWPIGSGTCCENHTELSICVDDGCALNLTEKKLLASWYEVIGEAYIHGVMDGRALEVLDPVHLQEFNFR